MLFLLALFRFEFIKLLLKLMLVEQGANASADRLFRVSDGDLDSNTLFFLFCEEIKRARRCDCLQKPRKLETIQLGQLNLAVAAIL